MFIRKIICIINIIIIIICNYKIENSSKNDKNNFIKNKIYILKKNINRNSN